MNLSSLKSILNAVLIPMGKIHVFAGSLHLKLHTEIDFLELKIFTKHDTCVLVTTFKRLEMSGV